MKFTIKFFTKRVSAFLSDKRSNDLFIVLIIILTSTASFGLGILSKGAGESEPIRVIDSGAASILSKEELGGDNVVVVQERDPGGYVVASKNGARYHFPWCSGAQSIKEENKIWFQSVEEAKDAGYTPASNCKGLE